MKRLSVLAINYSSPPMASARAIQVSRLLPELDADVTLFCGIDEDEAIDNTIAPWLDGALREVVRIPFKRSIAAKVSGKIASGLGARNANLPDSQKRWNPSLLRRVREKWDFIGPDVVLTFGNPMSTHLAGLELKRQYGAPWVAHFSDPWADNPYLDLGDDALRATLAMESEVVEAADVLIFTSPETIGLVMMKYPEELRSKAVYLPHCHDAALFAGLDGPPGDVYVMRSVGTFYGRRSPEPFLRALQWVVDTQPELLKNVQIEFTGSMIGQTARAGDYPGARSMIKMTGRADYADGLKLIAGANCLLSIDAPGAASVFFPSKLVDYLGSGRYIFAVTPKGAAARIVEKAGGAVADPSDDAGVRSSLVNILKNRPSVCTRFATEYAKEAVAADMMNILNNISIGESRSTHP